MCQTSRTLFRWKNSSINILNVAFVRRYEQDYFMDQCQVNRTNQHVFDRIRHIYDLDDRTIEMAL
jgi:hypothetical protein